MKSDPKQKPPAQQLETLEEKLAPFQGVALGIEHLSAGLVLATCEQSALKDKPLAFQAYHDNILQKCGQPTDPIEVMLIEQEMWAHMAIGRLYVTAGGANDANALGIFAAAIARMMAEFRRTALALKQYKTSAPPAQLTVVQNTHVSTGDQQVAVIGNPSDLRRSEKNGSESQLGSKPPLEALSHEPLPEFLRRIPGESLPAGGTA